MARRTKPSKNLSTKNALFRGKVLDIYNKIKAAKNIHDPDKVKLKKEIINDIENILDEDIRKQIRELTDSFPYILLVGNRDKALLAACYAHCDRDIDQSNMITKCKQLIDKRNKATENDASMINNSFIEGTSNVPDSSPAVQRAPSSKEVLSFIVPRLKNFEYEDRFSEKLSADGKDVEKWVDWYRSGYTVFLRSLDSEDNDRCRNLAKSMRAIKIRDPRDKTLAPDDITSLLEEDDNNGLFMISTDSINNLPDYLREGFEVILLDEDKQQVPGVDKAIIKVGNNYLKRIDIGKEKKLLPIQIKLLKLLDKNRNTHVTREYIYESLWNGRAYDDQITDHISKLVEAFAEMDFEKDVVKKKIIVTVKKSSKNSHKGGYIFCNNLVLLDYD